MVQQQARYVHVATLGGEEEGRGAGLEMRADKATKFLMGRRRGLENFTAWTELTADRARREALKQTANPVSLYLQAEAMKYERDVGNGEIDICTFVSGMVALQWSLSLRGI